jgi:hypothetical protein
MAALDVSRHHRGVGRRLTATVARPAGKLLACTLTEGTPKVRHYGFLSPNFSVPIQKIREMVCVLYELLRHQPVRVDPPAKPRPLRCPTCNALMCWSAFIPPQQAAMVT